MSTVTGLEVLASTLNDLDDRLPKSRSRCFDIGIWGGCGLECGAFLDGECEEPQEIPRQDVVDYYGKDADVLTLYEYYRGDA